MTTELTWKEAIIKILSSSSTPLRSNEITEKIISEGLRTTFGATPTATVNSTIYTSIQHDGEKSPYILVSKGLFMLKERSFSDTVFPEKLTPAISEAEEEEQYSIVSSFGMFWKRDAVEWSSTPKLLGIQKKGATVVNFSKQIGIYLLYDGREVIYVGRTVDALGKRLYKHTTDRMSVRWDRFSWFGLLPVSDDGSLDALPAQYNATKLIPVLEAILIEALEPRQNREQGDGLMDVEYLQKTDPEIEKRRFQRYMMAQ